MTKMINVLKRIVNIPNILDNLVTEFNSLGQSIKYPKTISEFKPPFVVIFIQAVKVIKDDDGTSVKTRLPVTLSFSGYAPNIFSFQPNIPIADLQIAIICDVSKVLISRIVVANVNICPSTDGAPLAYFNGIVDVCNRIMIDVTTR